MFAELCSVAPPIELERIHRFTNQWEAAASLQLRHGDLRALDAYEAHRRIIAGPIDDHLEAIADQWIQRHALGEAVVITTATNDHVDAINHLIQQHRLEAGDLDPTRMAWIADGEVAVGDIVATRRNNRQLHATSGDTVRNRELWTVTQITDAGDLTVTQLDGHGTVTLPADYAGQHVRLGYAATEPGVQSDNQTGSLTLATPATTGRGLYVAMTRGQQENLVYVVTDTDDIAEARDVLEAIMTSDRADTPAITQRRLLAQQHRQSPRPRPRCEIPDWFHRFREFAIGELDDARDAVDRSRLERQPLQYAVQRAERRFAIARETGAPFEQTVNDTQQAVALAEAERYRANRALADAGRLHKRQPRADLEQADRDLADAQTIHEAAIERAHPYRHEHADAVHKLRATREQLESFDRLERWHYLPEKLAAAEQHLEALDTSQRWASGQPVTHPQLTTCAATLDEHSQHDYGRYDAALLDVVQHWARTNNLSLRIEPLTPAPSIVIELDL